MPDQHQPDQNNADATPDNLTPLGELGEFGLIDRLTADFAADLYPDIRKGVGDDAAVVFTGHDCQLITTDLLLEGIHFDLSYVPLTHLGYKAVAVNLSDIYAMNARPYAITVSVGCSSRFTVEALEALYAGIRACCEQFGVQLIGGDTSGSKQGLAISITALGRGKVGEIVYRSGARENDLICVTGDLGGAFAGLQILEREKAVHQQNPDVQPDLQDHEYAVGRQLRPEPRADIIDLFRTKLLIPSAMLDLSDGLASDLQHICKASDCGAALYQEKLPVDPRTNETLKLFDHPKTSAALYGGEDYELLFTIPQPEYDKLAEFPDVRVIGHILPPENGIQLLFADGQMAPLERLGWAHFKGGGED